MSNTIRGILELENGMTMQFDYNALATFEDISGKEALVVMGQFDKGRVSISDLRNLYFASLKRHQPTITIDEAGDVMTDYPDAIQKVIAAAMPDVPVGNATGAKSRKR